MAISESQKRAMIKYQNEKLKRIPLDVRKEQFPAIKAAAEEAGESVNGYIKKAISIRMMLGI